MKLIVLDFETHYAKDYTLSKLSTEEYVNDHRFEAIGLAVSVDGGEPQWFSGTHAETRAWLEQFDIENNAVLAHNAMFDCAILAFQFSLYPKVIFDTLSMGRALHGLTVGNSLDKLTKYYGVGEKGTEVHNFIGYTRASFSPSELQAYAEYCKQDVRLTYKLFEKMMMRFSKPELTLIDMTIRMFTEPQFMADAQILETHLADVRLKQADMLAALNITKEDTRSDAKFADLLRSLGVEPPTKISAKTGKEAYAFAKTDEGLKELANHPDHRVQMAVAARLGTKSTIEETRTERLIQTQARNTGFLPIQLSYYGARTGRWCLTADHEVLTKNGWVPLSAWDKSPIMQWDKDNKQLSWCAAPALNSFEVCEHLYEFTGGYHKGCYTAEHRIPCVKRHTNDVVKDKTAKELASLSHLDMFVSGYSNAEDYPISDAALRLIVAMHADGHDMCKNGNNCVRFKFKKARKVARLQGLLDSIRIPHTNVSYPSEPDVNVIIVKGEDAPEWFRSAKKLPVWFYQLSARQIKIVLDELPHWDGYVSGTNSFVWVGCDAAAADILSTIAHMCGYRTKRKAICRKPHGWNTAHKINFTPALVYREHGVKHSTLTQHRGLVFCPTVDTGYFLCRRHESIFVTGNSAAGATNFQNIPRASPIKKGVIAPPGHMIVQADLSNIELRVGLWVAGQMDKLQKLQDGVDLYKDFASSVFGVAYDDVTKEQRFVGKTSQLSLIYGVGAAKLRAALKQGSGVDIGETEAKRIVDMYRTEYSSVAASWRKGNEVLEAIRDDMAMTFGYNDVIPVHGASGMLLPSGMYLSYPGLRFVASHENGKNEWKYDRTPKLEDRVYGAKVYQSAIQSLARCVMGEAMVRINKVYRVGLTVHDALYLAAPTYIAEDVLKFVIDEMTTTPEWLPGIVLGAEGSIGNSLKE